MKWRHLIMTKRIFTDINGQHYQVNHDKPKQAYDQYQQNNANKKITQAIYTDKIVQHAIKKNIYLSKRTLERVLSFIKKGNFSKEYNYTYQEKMKKPVSDELVINCMRAISSFHNEGEQNHYLIPVIIRPNLEYEFADEVLLKDNILDILIDILSLVDETYYYNFLPNSVSTDIDPWVYWDNCFDNLRKKVWVQYSPASDEALIYIHLIEEVQCFVRSYSPQLPKQLERWIEAYPKIQYYNAAYDLMSENMNLYNDIRLGKYPSISLSIYPTIEEFEKRNQYLSDLKLEYSAINAQYTDLKIFSIELIKAFSAIAHQDLKNLKEKYHDEN